MSKVAESEAERHGGREAILEPGTDKFFGLVDGKWYEGEIPYSRKKDGKIEEHFFRREMCYVETFDGTLDRGVWVHPRDLARKIPKGGKEANKISKDEKFMQHRFRNNMGEKELSDKPSISSSVGKKRYRELDQGRQYFNEPDARREKIREVQVITNWEEDLCRDMLQNSNWNVEAAVNQILSSGMMGGMSEGTFAMSPDLPPVPIEPPTMKKTLSLVDDLENLEAAKEEDGILELSNFLFRLPDMGAYNELQAQNILASITDAAVQNDLQKQCQINTDDRETQFIPLRTENDGNCLLHSISVSLYGQHDRKLVLRSCLRNVFKENGCEFSDALKSRWGVCQMEEREVSEKQLDAGFDNLRRQASLSKQIDAWGRMKHAFLESSHVLFLAHIIRRPILVKAAGPEDAEGNIYPADDICGLYLPFEIPAYECYQTPLVLAFAGSHFTPLVCIESETNPMRVKIGDRMPLQFLKRDEERRQLIEDYLNIEMDPDTEELFALMDFGEYPEVVQTLMQDWLKHQLNGGGGPINDDDGEDLEGEPGTAFRIGEIVEVRNNFMEAWSTGSITSLNPTKVALFGVEGEKAYAHMKKTNLGYTLEENVGALDETLEGLSDFSI